MIVLLVHCPLFNISGKHNPTWLELDDEAALVQYRVNMLESVKESPRNSLSQCETVSTDTGFFGPT